MSIFQILKIRGIERVLMLIFLVLVAIGFGWCFADIIRDFSQDLTQKIFPVQRPR